MFLFQSVQFNHSIESASLRLHGLQHTRFSCPSPTPGACSNSSPLSQWCHSTISFSVLPFSSCLQSFPASGSFQMSQFFSSCGQSIKASDSVCPKNTQCWFPLGLTGWISLQAKGLSGVFSCTTIQKHQFFGTHYISKASNLWRSVFYGSTLTSVNDYWKNHSFDYRKLCQQNDVSAF